MGFILIEMKSIIVPLVLASIIGFILNPIIKFLKKKHIPELISILLVIALTFFVLFIIGKVINGNIQSFMANIQQYEPRLKSLIQEILALLGKTESSITKENFSEELPGLAAVIENVSIRNIVTKILNSVTVLLSNTFLVLLYLVFILIGRNKLAYKFDAAFNPEISTKMKDISRKITEQINKYILTKTLISLMTGSLVYVTLLLFGVEFAFIWGLLTFLLNYIPNIGSIIATIFPITFALIQFESFVFVIWIAVILFLIQFVVGSLLEPKIVGQSMGISPLVVLFSLIFWGYVWGIIGMVLAVPFAVFIKIVFENISGLRPLSVMMSDKV